MTYAWRGKFLVQFSDDFGILRFSDACCQVDLSASCNLTKRLRLQLDVLNATRSQFIDKTGNPRYPHGLYGLTPPRILAGLHYAM